MIASEGDIVIRRWIATDGRWQRWHTYLASRGKCIRQDGSPWYPSVVNTSPFQRSTE